MSAHNTFDWSQELEDAIVSSAWDGGRDANVLQAAAGLRELAGVYFICCVSFEFFRCDYAQYADEGSVHHLQMLQDVTRVCINLFDERDVADKQPPQTWDKISLSPSKYEFLLPIAESISVRGQKHFCVYRGLVSVRYRIMSETNLLHPNTSDEITLHSNVRLPHNPKFAALLRAEMLCNHMRKILSHDFRVPFDSLRCFLVSQMRSSKSPLHSQPRRIIQLKSDFP